MDNPWIGSENDEAPRATDEERRYFNEYDCAAEWGDDDEEDAYAVGLGACSACEGVFEMDQLTDCHSPGCEELVCSPCERTSQNICVAEAEEREVLEHATWLRDWVAGKGDSEGVVRALNAINAVFGSVRRGA